MKYIVRPIIVNAYQWFVVAGRELDRDVISLSSKSTKICDRCNKSYKYHGQLNVPFKDAPEFLVCPGDYILKKDKDSLPTRMSQEEFEKLFISAKEFPIEIEERDIPY